MSLNKFGKRGLNALEVLKYERAIVLSNCAFGDFAAEATEPSFNGFGHDMRVPSSCTAWGDISSACG